MQFIVESSWSFAAFTLIAIVCLSVVTYLIFVSKRPFSKNPPGTLGPASWVISPTRMLPTLIAFGMMFIGMALVGAWYYVQTPIVNSYEFNLMAVAIIAASIAVVASYGIALMGLYAKSV
jgi:hypothetical protein